MAEHSERPQPQAGARYKYILIQRCRHFGNWPDDFRYQDELRKIHLGTDEAEAVPVYLSFGVITHDSPKRDDGGDYRADEERPRKGSLLLDPTHRPGFWIGNTILAGVAEDPQLYSFKFNNAAPGEIDFFVGIQCQSAISPKLLQDSAEPFLEALVASASIYLDDFVVPVTPSHLLTSMDTGEKQQTNSYVVRALARPTISREDIKRVFQQFFSQVQILEPERRRGLVVAARRYLSSFGEVDPIDRYCDLWEACEFLVRNLTETSGRKIKGGITARMAYAVARQTGLSKPRLDTHLAQPLYEIRKNIVHNAIDDPEGFDHMTRYIEVTVNQIFRFVLGMPPAPSPELGELLAKIR